MHIDNGNLVVVTKEEYEMYGIDGAGPLPPYIPSTTVLSGYTSGRHAYRQWLLGGGEVSMARDLIYQVTATDTYNDFVHQCSSLKGMINARSKYKPLHQLYSAGCVF